MTLTEEHGFVTLIDALSNLYGYPIKKYASMLKIERNCLLFYGSPLRQYGPN